MSKKQDIKSMFDRISKRYDLANNLLSFGLHHFWKKKTLKLLSVTKKDKVLDLCCGTGDLLFQLGHGIGLDLSFEMLREAKEKTPAPLVCADAEKLPFYSEWFDKVIIGFGIRNIPFFEKALNEIHRILKPGGKLAILEFSKPKGKFFPKLYFYYLTKLLPKIGGWISKNRDAYEYLPKSIQRFPDGKDFLICMEQAHFKNLKICRLSLGIASIYCGRKASDLL